MRGSVVVLALTMLPFVGAVSKAQDTTSTTSSPKVCVKDPGNPSTSGDENRSKKCPTPPPPTTGTVTISGTVFFDLAPYDGIFDVDNEVGISGWNVVLTGPTGSMSFMTVTGPFSFAGLPGDATYTLCVEPSPGWTQTSPTSGAPCLNSFGYTIVVPPLAADSTITRNFGFYSNTTF